jgi:hypothetical protein
MPKLHGRRTTLLFKSIQENIGWTFLLVALRWDAMSLKVRYVNDAPVTQSDVKDLGLDKPHRYHNLFIELYVFADQYDVPQLRKDILTVLVDPEREI